jgi:hypothetical protein
VKLAHISPIPLLDQLLTTEDKFHLVVADRVLDNEKYLEFYRGRIRDKNYVIMDTPAFELEASFPADAMVEAVELLNPTEIVIPDDMDSAEATVTLAKDTIRLLRHRPGVKRYMVVPHGKDVEQYVRCAKKLADVAGQNMVAIGIQEEIPELYGMTRAALITRLHVEIPRSYFHYLGADDQLRDLVDRNFLNTRVGMHLRSCDTAKLVVYGLNGIIVQKLTTAVKQPYPGRKSVGGRTGYFDYDTADGGAIMAARKNIERWREI